MERFYHPNFSRAFSPAQHTIQPGKPEPGAGYCIPQYHKGARGTFYSLPGLNLRGAEHPLPRSFGRGCIITTPRIGTWALPPGRRRACHIRTQPKKSNRHLGAPFGVFLPHRLQSQKGALTSGVAPGPCSYPSDTKCELLKQHSCEIPLGSSTGLVGTPRSSVELVAPFEIGSRPLPNHKPKPQTRHK